MALAQYGPYNKDGFGIIEMRAGGSSPTVTVNCFVKRDSTNHGVIDVAAQGEPCVGIALNTSATANETIMMATSGVWKTTGLTGHTLEPGDVFYTATNSTIRSGVGLAGSGTAYPQGIICQSTAATGATTLYILLIPSELNRAVLYATS